MNRAALQTERVGDSKIVPDPRPELKYDSAEWTRLLARVEAFDPMCAGVLHGFRCGGLRLHRGGKGYTLRPEFDPATSIWADESAYKADRDAWLVPHTEVIITALRWLGSPVEAAEHAVATGNVTVIVE
ncbi:MAG: hypothetical protein Q8R92_01685 [Deltaproteobacteria bacterium]|nr:hypothetical protein [Deltaproteobacteria bacterium]